MNELTKIDNLIKWNLETENYVHKMYQSQCFEIQDCKCNFVFQTGYNTIGAERLPLSLSIILKENKKINPPVYVTVRVISSSKMPSISRQTITGENVQLIWSSFDFSLRGSLTFEIIVHDVLLNGDNRSEKCFSCKESLEAEFISLHKKCIDRPMKCSDCSDVILIQDWLHGHECVKERAEDTDSISADFMKMLKDGNNYDLILKVGDEEIRAHKDVLRARCQVFKSMLDHDMKEKNSGIIDVADCDPEAMKVFLSYVYCGKVDTFHQNNMLHLYYIADKYQMSDLKKECCTFIQQSISPTNFCDVIQLALNHSESALFNFATEYFNHNVMDVLKTVEWQSFMKDNSTVANELFIKSYQNKK